MSPNGAQSNMKSFFFGCYFLWSFISGKFGRIRAKILRNPKNLAAPTPMSSIENRLNPRETKQKSRDMTMWKQAFTFILHNDIFTAAHYIDKD